MNSAASTEIAGGQVPNDLSTNDVCHATFGCKATKTGVGVVRVDLDAAQDFDLIRTFVGLRGGPGTVFTYGVQVISATSFVVTTYVVTLVGGPALAITATDVAFSFSVSQVPT